MIQDYMRTLTDDTGIFQHSKFGVPDRSKGYTTDDNSRAFIVAVMRHKYLPEQHSLDLVQTYLSFIYQAQNKDGTFKNFMSFDRQFIDDKGSDDCLGRTIWALGYAVSEHALPDNMHNTCLFMLNQSIHQIGTVKSPRAIAYAIIGLSLLLKETDWLCYSFPYPLQDMDRASLEFLNEEMIRNMIEALSSRLQMQYRICSSTNWHWFEDSLTYGNAMLPWSLLKASQSLENPAILKTAKESLHFLISKTFVKADYYKPIGSHGWLMRDGKAALYDEQPIEACEMMLACREAYDILGDIAYLDYADLCYQWYLGRNSLRLSLIDPRTGGCFDGIHARGLNLNQGSESILSYAIAQMVMNHG